MTLLQPLGDRVIVQMIEDGEITVGGVIIPDLARERPHRGIVLGVGPGPRGRDGDYLDMGIEEGDEIVFSKYGGTDVQLDGYGGAEVLVLREADLLAKVVG